MIIVLALLIGILLFTSRRACAFERPDPKQWTTIVETDNGTGYYADLKTAKFSKESDGHHVIFYDQLLSIGDKLKVVHRYITKKDFNLSRKTTRDLSFIVYDESGEVVRDTSGAKKESERSLFPGDAKFHPIATVGYEPSIYGMLLLDFLGLKSHPADDVAAVENLDPVRWVPIYAYDGQTRGYVDVKDAVFSIEPDGPHAFFWYLRKGDVLPKEPDEYILCNIEMNLIYGTDRLLDCMILNERGEVLETCPWSSDEQKLEPPVYGSEAAAAHEVILGCYAAEKVIPSEGALVFRKPDPERWLLVYDGDEIDEVSIYIDTVNTVFYKDRDGVHAVFWYQVIPPAHERFRLRTIARFRMNLTKKTYYVSDTVEFDDEGQVEGSYTHGPDEIEIETVFPDTAMEVIYDYLLESSKSAKMLKLKSQSPKKATGTKKPKAAKRKTTSEKTKRSRKK